VLSSGTAEIEVGFVVRLAPCAQRITVVSCVAGSLD
jgi:hypothetical protein